MYYVYGSVRAIPTYKVYRLYDNTVLIYLLQPTYDAHQSYRLCNIFHILPAVRAIYILLHSCGLTLQATPDPVARLATNQLTHPNHVLYG